MTSTRTSRGFTLIELMISSTLAMIVMGAVLVAFSATTKHFRAVANYGLIHKEGRMAVDVFGQDLRKASNLTNVGSTSITLVIPTGFNAQGNATGTKNVKYYKSGTSLIRQDLTLGQSRTLSANVSTMTFTMYDRIGNATAQTTSCKGIQVDVKLSRNLIGTAQTEDFLSARLVARNKL